MRVQELLPKFVLLALILLYSAIVAYGSWLHSPTLNEPSHLAAGITNWNHGSFELYKVNPPLVRMVAAVPFLASNFDLPEPISDEVPGSRRVFGIGEDFANAHEARILWIVCLARWSCLPLSLIGVFVSYCWTRDLIYSSVQPSCAIATSESMRRTAEWGGVFAAALWCFSPNMIGHGQLITPDAHAASLGLTATYSFSRWLRLQTWTGCILVGACLGVAELAKSTFLVFFLLWPTIWVCYRIFGDKPFTVRAAIKGAVKLQIMFAVGIYVLNLGYGFEGTLTKWNDLRFVSQLFKSHESAICTFLGNMPLLLPENYVLGIDVQQRDFESYGSMSYLNGVFRPTGWWQYYFWVLLLKVPLGMWLLAMMASFLTLFRPRRVLFRDHFTVLIVPITIFLIASLKNGFSQHGRYVLPCFPYLYVWTATVLTVQVLLVRTHKKTLLCIIVFSTAWAWSSTVSIFPHFLSYFNELAGGPEYGPRFLLHSNVDWGQDLRKLGHWLERHPEASPIRIAYHGPIDPSAAGIDCIPVVPDSENSERTSYPSGWYAVSVNLIYGVDFPARGGVQAGKPALVDPIFWQSHEPIERIGYSIYVFHLD